LPQRTEYFRRDGPKSLIWGPWESRTRRDDLYVVDTSFFVSIGAVNPSLTAMANALRVGDHLRARLRA
jgi:choline dehydrogenase-like flavoprotein